MKMAGCCRGLLLTLALAAALAPCSGATLRHRRKGNENSANDAVLNVHPEWLHSFLTPYNLLHLEAVPLFASRPFLMKITSIVALLSVASAIILSSSGHGVSEKLTAIKCGLTSPKSEAKEEEAKEEVQTNEVPASLSDDQLKAIEELKKATRQPEKQLPPLVPGLPHLGSTMFAPPVADTTCCAGGIMALFSKNPACARRKQPEVKFLDHDKGNASKSFANDGLCQKAKPQSSEEHASPDFSGQKAMPQSSKEDASPNFSGTWKCVKTEGALDGFLKDLGKSLCKRKACAAFRFGAGSVTRQCEHVGNHLKVTQRVIGIPSLAQEWDIGKEEQEVVGKDEPFLQTANWDPDDRRVLVIESKDLNKSKPNMWTTSRQYFVDTDRFRIDSTSGGGHTASWIFQRQAPSGTQC